MQTRSRKALSSQRQIATSPSSGVNLFPQLDLTSIAEPLRLLQVSVPQTSYHDLKQLRKSS